MPAAGARLVANQVQQRVKTAVAAAKGVSDSAERSQAVSAAWTAAPEAVMPAQRSERTQGGQSNQSSDPVDAALQRLDAAKQAVENAVADKGASKARNGEEAQRQQDAIRRIGRILTKVKVDADDGDVIVDAELVEG